MSRLFKGRAGRSLLRAMSLLVTLAMLLSLLPAQALAQAGQGVGVESISVMAGEAWSLAPAAGIEAGGAYTVQVTVQNGGSDEAAGLSVALYVYGEGGAAGTTLGETQAVDSLAPGAGIILDFAWTPQEAGEYDLKAVVTTGGEELDAEELTVTVLEAQSEEEDPVEAGTSVSVENIMVMAGEPGALEPAPTIVTGETYTVQVTVNNDAGSEAEDLGSALYEVRGGVETAIGETQGVDSLAPGAGITLDFAWTPQEAGEYTLRAVLTAGGEAAGARELAVSVAGLFPMMALAEELDEDTSDPLFGLDFNYGVIEEFTPLPAPESIAADFPDGHVFVLPFSDHAEFSSTDQSLLNGITKHNMNGELRLASSGSSGGRHHHQLKLSEYAYSPETDPEWRSMFGTELYVVKLGYQSEVHYLLLSESYTVGEDVYTIARKPGYSTNSTHLPKSATYLCGDTAAALQYTITNLTAGAAGVGNVTYQWFVSPENNVEGAMELPNADLPAYTPTTANVGTAYYYLVITNTLAQGNTPSRISVTTTPLTMISIMDVPGWDSETPQDIPLDLRYENDARLNKITISGVDVVSAGGTWSLDEDTQMNDYTYDIVLSPESGTGNTITVAFDFEDRVSGSNNILFPSLSRYSVRAEVSSSWHVKLPLGKTTLLNSLRENRTEFSETLTNEGASIEVFLYRNISGEQNLGGAKFRLNFTTAYEDPAPETVQSLSVATPPNRTAYLYGEIFDPTGMVVMAHLQDGTEAEVRGYAVSPSGPLALEDDKVTISYGGKSVELEIDVSAAPVIGKAEMKNGQFIMEQPLYDERDAHVVVLYGEAKGLMDITVPAGASVTLNGAAQTVTSEGKCSLSLGASGGETGTANTIVLGFGGETSTYTVTCHSQLYSGMPGAVADYLCIDSQYTNGMYMGQFLLAYGLNGVSSLVGSDNTTGGMYSGPTSLGNFGGYITYYYEDAVRDNPNNPYGVDFIVFGNSVEGSNQFAEPGQVWVSEDGEDWYALAGSLHYDDCAQWDKSATYSKASKGTTRVTSDGVTELSSYYYPVKKNYPLFGWPEGSESSITLGGVSLSAQSGENEYGNILPQFPDFGYADVGLRGSSNSAGNPYLGSYKSGSRTFISTTDGMDLAWAVDASGQPVSFPDGIHYIKVQTVSDIDNGGIGEKSTEVNMVRVAEANETSVGKTFAPGSITVDGQAVPLSAGISSYNVSVTGGFTVLVDAGDTANVYINGSRTRNVTYSEIPAHGMLRVIVQEGMKEPVIYYLTLTDTGETPVTSQVTLDANGGKINGQDSVTLTYDAGMAGSVFPTPTRSGYTFVGWKGVGQAYYTAYSADLTGDVTLTAIWKETASNPDPGPVGNQISVSFRLIGSTLSDDDVDLSEGEAGYHGAKYFTWIKTNSYTINEGETVYDLFVQALENAGLTALGQDKNYVKTIYAPSVCGGYALSEMTNGKRSGWMYTVDGEHPLFGLKDCALQDGDAVVWHYVNDYAYEVHDWANLGGSGYPALGDSTYWNKWLEAEDRDPNASDSSGVLSPSSPGSSTLVPKATATNGAAAVKLSTSDITSAIKDVKEKGNTAIVITPEITGEANKVTVELPKSSLTTVASETDAGLTVETPVGSLTIPNSALASIAAQASGGTVTVSLEAVDNSSLTPAQQTVVGDKPVYDITIASGGSSISSFSGGAITVSLPYTLKDGEDPSGVTVWYLSDDGQLQQVACAYDPETGLAAFTTDHLSCYVVGYAEYVAAPVWTNPFTDVKPDDWFYDSVAFAVQSGLFSGASATTFSPSEPMTRAMLVTVLYRLEGQPSVTGANSFSDVESGQWYTDAVLWANANGIVTGYGSGQFGTNDSITREQMAAILYNYAKHKGYDVTATADLSAYTDAAEISGWAQSAMQWANAGGLIAGTTPATLEPAGTATRAQVASILMRFVENVVR